jgi:hypothetical protein
MKSPQNWSMVVFTGTVCTNQHKNTGIHVRISLRTKVPITRAKIVLSRRRGFLNTNSTTFVTQCQASQASHKLTFLRRQLHTHRHAHIMLNKRKADAHTFFQPMVSAFSRKSRRVIIRPYFLMRPWWEPEHLQHRNTDAHIHMRQPRSSSLRI